MKKCLTVLGARPQFIKAAAVSRRMQADGRLHELIVHTGQHYDASMSDVFFDELGIPAPHRALGIGSGPHGEQTGRMLAAIEQVIREEAPDWVLVYGDTNSTLAGALAAAKLHVPVAHVEAGLRSFNRRMPEEVNRVLTDHCAELLLAPTEVAVGHLRREGLDEARIACVGDVMYDATRYFAARARTRDQARRLGVEAGRFVLATVHRAENTDDPARLEEILEALERVATELPVVLPLHPRTRARVDAARLASAAVQVVEPLGYLDMQCLEQQAAVVATDSGGVQKEAYFHGVPCVTLREETEWTELVELGWNRLAPPGRGLDLAQIVLASIGRAGDRSAAPYGDGDAAGRVVERIASHA